MNYLIYGKEKFRIKQEVDKIIDKYADDSKMNINTFDAFNTSINVILEDANTIPFISDNKVIIVNNANYFSTTNDSKEDPTMLIEYLKSPLATTILVLVGSFEKIDTRKKIGKEITKLVEVIVKNEIDENEKKEIINSYITKYNIDIDAKVKSLLYGLLGNDINMINNEFIKLSLYNDKIDEDILKSLVVRDINDNVFDLVNFLVNNDKTNAISLYKDLSMVSVEPIALIGLLAAQYRFIFKVKHLMNQGYGKGDIAQMLGAHPYRIQMTMMTANKLTIDNLLKKLYDLATLDQSIKTGKVDKKLGFELMLINA